VAKTPLTCLPSLLRRSSFGYEGRELGKGTADFFNTPNKSMGEQKDVCR
jgi:hypothetical protein